MPWGRIASVFVDIEGEEPKQEPEAKEAETASAAPAAPAAPAAAAPTPAPASTVPTPTLPGTVNEEMVEFLSAAIEAADLPGFDYIEFRDSLAKMAKVPLAEAQKYQAVFATAQAMGLTKEKLIESIVHYQGVLENKKTEFMAHVEDMIAKEVTHREQIKAQKEAEIVALTEQIQQATASINEKQQEIGAISGEIFEANQNIQNTAASFEATYSFVAGKLEEDKGKIDTYLAASQ